MGWTNYGLAHRPVVMGTRGMVASAHPLASVAGLRMLMDGGNAVDAAVAVAAALNVCEPYMSGMGGLGYMLVYTARDRTLRVLDYIGRSPYAAVREAFSSPEEKEVGPKSPLVPGSVGGWLTALETHGRLDRAAVFTPAIEYAEQGVPITLQNANFFRLAEPRLADGARATFLPEGVVPVPGTVLKQPLLAATFREIVAGGQEAFYQGEIGKRIVRAVADQGGLLTEQDLADFRPEWQTTVSTAYLVGELNESYVKVVKAQGEFVWHHHEVEDELFLVVKGRLLMRLRDREIRLEEGDFLVVPRGVEHQPVAEEAQLLVVEPKATLNTGNVRNERTVAELERL